MALAPNGGDGADMSVVRRLLRVSLSQRGGIGPNLSENEKYRSGGGDSLSFFDYLCHVINDCMPPD